MASPPHIPVSQPTPSRTPPAITAREAAILPHILLCTKDTSRLQFDWAKLAQRMGMKNPRSAANAWLAMRKKIEALALSAASSSANPPPHNKLTQNDQRFLANAVSCTKRPLDVDYAALALKLGMTNPRSASNAWAALRKKIAAGGSEAAAGESVSVKRAAAKMDLKGRGTAGTMSRRPAAKQDPDSSGAGQSLPFKVVKRESESWTDEKRSAGYDFAKSDCEPNFHGLSVNQALSMRHVHMMAAADEAEESRVRVKDEYFDEC